MEQLWGGGGGITKPQVAAGVARTPLEGGERGRGGSEDKPISTEQEESGLCYAQLTVDIAAAAA